MARVNQDWHLALKKQRKCTNCLWLKTHGIKCLCDAGMITDYKGNDLRFTIPFYKTKMGAVSTWIRFHVSQRLKGCRFFEDMDKQNNRLEGAI